MPPSTVSTCADMKPLSSPARKAIALAISSTVPRRPNGVRAIRRASSYAFRFRIVPAVGMSDGATALTLMLRAPSSAAARVIPITPALMPL